MTDKLNIVDTSISEHKKKQNTKLEQVDTLLGYGHDDKGKLTRQLKLADGKDYGYVSLDLYNGIANGNLTDDLYNKLNDKEKKIFKKIKTDISNTKVPVYGADGNKIGELPYTVVEQFDRGNIDSYILPATKKIELARDLFLNNNLTRNMFLSPEKTLEAGKTYTFQGPPTKEEVYGKLSEFSGKPIDELVVIGQLKKEPLFPLTIEVDGEKKNFGNVSYNAIKRAQSGDVGSYKPTTQAEQKAIDDYVAFVEEYAKKQREPENFWQGLLHGIGYTAEKSGAGAVDAVEDVSDIVGFAAHSLFELGGDWDTYEERLNQHFDELFTGDSLGDQWSANIDSRYRVPDWYREWGGMISFEAGGLIPAIVAEIATASAAPTVDTKVANITTKIATKGVRNATIKSTVKTAAKKLAKKIITPSNSILFLKSASSATKLAYKETRDKWSSLSYGILNGLGEVATEKLFGGIGGTGIGADELFDLGKIKGIRRIAGNKFGKKVLDIALEGVEELIMTDLDPWFRKATIEDDLNMLEELDPTQLDFWQKRGEAALQGVLLSSFMSASTFTIDKAGNAINSVGKKINKNKTINILNANAEAINSMFENESDKMDPLSKNATVEEIKERQKQIAAFTAVYTELAESEVVKSNPNVFADNTKAKATPSTELSTSATKVSGTAPVSTEGGIVTSASKSIDNIVSGKATNKDYDLFKVGQIANRQAFEDATGLKLPATNSETRKFLRDFSKTQGIKKTTLSKKDVEGASNLSNVEFEEIINNASIIKSRAENVQKKLDNVMNNIVNKYGLVGSFGGTKSIKSMVEKVIRKKYNEGVEYNLMSMKDHARGTININNYDEASTVVNDLMSQIPNAQLEVKNNANGYFGIHITGQIDGINVEVQVHTKEASRIKEISDEIYHKWRNVDRDSYTEKQKLEYLNDEKKIAKLYSDYFTSLGINPNELKSRIETEFAVINVPITPLYGTHEPSFNSKASSADSLIKNNLVLSSERYNDSSGTSRPPNDTNVDITTPPNNIILPEQTDVKDYTPDNDVKNDIPTYDEYKAEIEKHFPGIDEKYIKERYNARYSDVESPDVKSEAKDIRVEVTNKVPAELEKTVKAVKVRSGIDIVFGNRYVDGNLDTNFRGMFDGKKIIVSENATKADIFNAVVLHELTHGIEGTKKYKGIYDYVLKEVYGIDTSRLDADVEAKIAEYKKNGIELTPEKAKGEIVAENVGKYIFADDVGSIVTKNYTLGQKILDVINELIYNIKKKFGNTFELDELASAQRKYRMALDEVKRNGVTNPNKAYAMGNKVYDYTKSFAEQVDDWKAGKIPQYDTLLIGKTPDVFKNIGVNSIPFTINQTHVDYAVNGTKDADHYIGEDMLKQLPQALENPVAIFQDTRNANIDNRLIALLKLTHNGKQVITPVAIDGFGRLNNKRIDSNAVVSMFARDKSVESMLNDAILSENYGNKAMFYWNKKEALSLLQRAGVQYPSGLPQDGFIHSIRENDAFVNYRLENVTHSKQFKDWFGDWLKNPKKASKVVNEDGTPKVVYHGTRSQFTKFNKWSYFTEDKNYADLYASETHGRPKGEVMAVYINSRKPFDIRNKEVMDIYEKEFIPTQKLDNDLLVTDIGLPHAVVADDLIRFIEEKGYDFDSIVLDEAGMDDGSGYERVSYVVKEPTQIKSATDNIGTFDGSDPDIRYSFASQNDIDSAVADFEAHYGEMYRGLIDKYKTIKPGERAQVEDVKVPKKTGKREYVSNYARTMAETRVFSEAMQGEFEKMVVDGTLSHERISNKSAESDAGSRIVRLGFEGAVNEFETLVNAGRVNKNDVALGQVLLNVACQNKDVELAKKLAVDLSMAATQFGQNVQAFSMLKRMSPDGQLYYLEKTVQKINDDIVNKYKGKYEQVEIDYMLAEKLLNAKNQDELNKAVHAIEKSIGEQIPASKMDKWNAWRYLAMLGNTRTHFRNLFGNMGFVPARKIKDMIGATIEKTVLPKSERTKSYTKTKESKDFAKQDFEKMSDIIKGNEGKYGTQRGIEEHRKIFETKWLEAARKFNTNALEFEDGIFLALAYKDAFAQAMTARGLTAEYLNSGTKEANADLQKIREYAINEAQKATYRDANAFSDFISGIKYRGDSKAIKAFEALTVEGVLPFKRTPANILVRGVEYSPAGLVKTILYDSFKLKSGDISASKYIDNLSSGLTGTGIAVLGAFLSHLGILVVAPDEDQDVAGYKKMMGAQNYALKFGDHTYTIDWMAPSSLPLFVGAEVYNTSKSEKGFSFKNITNAMSRITEPMFELSCLSGIQSALESIRYADEGSVVMDLALDMATSYVTQALPTIGGQFARTIDNTQRNAYYKDRNSNLDEVVESFINKSAAKIPFVSRMLPEKVDRWGRTQKYGSVAERVLENFASPGYYSKEAPTWTDSRIMTIYKNTGNKSVIPKAADKSFEVNGKMVYLSPDEYVEYSKTKGQLSYKYVTEFLKIPANIDDETRVEIISAIYEYSNAKAKEKVSDYELTVKYQKVDDAMKNGTSPAKYYYKYYTSKSKK